SIQIVQNRLDCSEPASCSEPELEKPRNYLLLPHEPNMNGWFAKSSDTPAHSPPHRFDQDTPVRSRHTGSIKTGGSPEQGEKTMFNTIKTAALSALIGLGTLAAIPATAQAD
ncbi:MAG: hypothetical protein E5V18_26025, partial [Mesorhizobium sp.]